MITLEKISYEIDNRKIINELSYNFQDKCFYGLIGPNGTGKSTLVQLISGILKANQGQLYINGQLAQSYSKKQLARQIAVLQQGGLEPLSYDVSDVLAMARYPYQGLFSSDKADSQRIIHEAIEKTNIAHLVHKHLDELSGGERQRVALAKLWVQRPKILLLDEPTTYLDIGYQQSVMEFIAKWQKEEQLLVIAVMHDINLAALYCEKIIALKDGEIVAEGDTKKVLTAELLEQLFAAQIDMIKHPHLNVPQMIMNHIK